MNAIHFVLDFVLHTSVDYHCGLGVIDEWFSIEGVIVMISSLWNHSMNCVTSFFSVYSLVVHFVRLIIIEIKMDVDVVRNF